MKRSTLFSIFATGSAVLMVASYLYGMYTAEYVEQLGKVTLAVNHSLGLLPQPKPIMVWAFFLGVLVGITTGSWGAAAETKSLKMAVIASFATLLTIAFGFYGSEHIEHLQTLKTAASYTPLPDATPIAIWSWVLGVFGGITAIFGGTAAHFAVAQK